MSKTKKKNKRTQGTPVKTKPNGLLKVILGLVGSLLILFYIFKPSATNDTYTGNKNMHYSSVYQFTKNGELIFQTPENEFITKIDIELANTEAKRAQGLMYRTEMKENQGMLFIFDDEDYRSFWMKNTILPLDMIFVNSEFEIVNIRKNTTPYDLSQYTSTGPAKYVVEVNAGFCSKYNIKKGDKISIRYL